MPKIILCFCILLFLQNPAFSQKEKATDKVNIAATVDLDSLVVTASRAGFSVEDFIAMVTEDESFYNAFRNIRFKSYLSTNNINMFDKKGEIKAAFNNLIQQHSDGNCRTMEVLDETIKGKYFKSKRTHKFYTGKLHDRLFLTHGRQCENPDIRINEIKSKSKMEKYIAELKKLIFKPGSEADIPFIGKKTAIFSPKMAKYYDYKISSQQYLDGVDCYVFSATVKPKYFNKPNKTVIKNLVTFIDKSDFQVVARDYRLAYATAVYDFDVRMKIELIKLGEKYLPTLIEYDGNWDIPTQKPEIAKFTIRFFDYE